MTVLHLVEFAMSCFCTSLVLCDRNWQCYGWSKLGYCSLAFTEHEMESVSVWGFVSWKLLEPGSTNAAYMNVNCRKSCNRCGGNTRPGAAKFNSFVSSWRAYFGKRRAGRRLIQCYSFPGLVAKASTSHAGSTRNVAAHGAIRALTLIIFCSPKDIQRCSA